MAIASATNGSLFNLTRASIRPNEDKPQGMRAAWREGDCGGVKLDTQLNSRHYSEILDVQCAIATGYKVTLPSLKTV